MRWLNVFCILTALVATAAFGGVLDKPLPRVVLSYEERVFLTYLLNAMGESPAVKVQTLQRATEFFKRHYQKPAQTIRVNSVNNFVRAYQGEWPNSYSVESDLELVESRGPRGTLIFAGSTEKVQNEINSYQGRMTNEWSQILDLTKFKGLLAQAQHQTATGPANKNAEFTYDLADSLFFQLTDQIKETAKGLAQSGQFKLDSPGMGLFMSKAMELYFDFLSPASKKQILSQMMGADLKMNLNERFNFMIQSAGPNLQKVLQVICREAGLSPELVARFKKLESDGRSLPPEIVQRILQPEVERGEISFYATKALGVGTMAQTHRGAKRVNGRNIPVVIRYLKPDIERRVREDSEILSRMAPIIDSHPELIKLGFPKLTSFKDSINKMTEAELDLDRTIAAQRFAQKIYNKKVRAQLGEYITEIEFYVPEVYPKTAESKIMVQEMIQGQKLETFVNQQNFFPKDQVQQRFAEELVKMWVREMLFGTGFFHSDLHPGNILVDHNADRIRASILDYGMTGQLEPITQKEIMFLGAALQISSSELVAQAFWSLSQKNSNKISYEEFLRRVRARSIELGTLSKLSTQGWVAWSSENGLEFKEDFVSLNRGIAILERMLAQVKSPNSFIQLSKLASYPYSLDILKALRSQEGFDLQELARLGVTTLIPRPPVTRPQGPFLCHKLFL